MHAQLRLGLVVLESGRNRLSRAEIAVSDPRMVSELHCNIQQALLAGVGAFCCIPVMQHRSTDDTHTEHVEPPLSKIEKMGVEQAGDYVLHDDDETKPGDQRLLAKQREMRGPHGEQNDAADDAEL